MMNYFANTRIRIALCGLTIGALPFSLGCGGTKTVASPAPQPAKVVTAPAQPPPAATLPSDAELERAGVNEVGVIPVLEYHAIDEHKGDMSRSPARFRHDLDRLYAQGFRPITMKEYLDNRIDLPLGRSPVILTFDDARPSQFRYLRNGNIDPTCAIGILQTFHEAHPDFPVKATFFVLTKEHGIVTAFGSEPSVAERKLRALYKMGCELQNHTLNHRYFHHYRLSDAAVSREIALGQASIQQIVPEAHVDVLALPGGEQPISHNHKVTMSGDADGIHYVNRGVFLAGDAPAPAPVAKKFVAWRIPRVLAVDSESGVTYWLDDAKRHPKRYYISDGNPNVVSVPAALQAKVDKAKLAGAELHVYGTIKTHAKPKARQKKPKAHPNKPRITT